MGVLLRSKRRIDVFSSLSSLLFLSLLSLSLLSLEPLIVNRIGSSWLAHADMCCSILSLWTSKHYFFNPTAFFHKQQSAGFIWISLSRLIGDSLQGPAAYVEVSQSK